MLIAAAAKLLQSCLTLCNPIDAAHKAPPSLGFSRQEHWSGSPFPSLMHESEKWKWSRSVVSQSSRPHGLQPTRLLCTWDFPGKSTGVGCHCLLLDAYYLIIFSSRNWRAIKPWSVYFDINLPCLSGRKRKFRTIHIKSKMLNPGHT